jgi:hypothetical protein
MKTLIAFFVIAMALMAYGYVFHKDKDKSEDNVDE